MNQDQGPAAGAVYIYSIHEKKHEFKGFKSYIESNEESSRFGFSVQWLAQGDLAIGAPKYSGESYYSPDDQGIVYLVKGANQISESITTDDIDVLYEEKNSGCLTGSGFLYESEQGILVFSSPQCHNVENGTQIRDSGRISMINLPH